MFAELFAIAAPVFLIAGFGALWAKLKAPFDAAVASNLALNVGTPCLAFASLTRFHMPAAELARLGLSALVIMAVTSLLGIVTLRLLRLQPNSYLPTVVFGNSGNMGLPLVLFAFGEQGLALAIGYLAATAMTNLTVGEAIARGHITLRSIYRSPILYGLGAAVVFVLFDLPVPQFVAATTKLLGDLAIPLMLLALGHSLVKLQVRKFGLAALIAAMRLGLGFVAGHIAASLLGLDGTGRAVAILMGSMPAAVANYVFALRYGRDHETVAGAVVLSTLASFATLPLLLIYLLP
jgi:predicted permease